jgi:hypothetical protein
MAVFPLNPDMISWVGSLIRWMGIKYMIPMDRPLPIPSIGIHLNVTYTIKI